MGANLFTEIDFMMIEFENVFKDVLAFKVQSMRCATFYAIEMFALGPNKKHIREMEIGKKNSILIDTFGKR